MASLSNIRIAITCTAPRCHDIQSTLHDRGYNTLALPALDVKTIKSNHPNKSFDAVLITSRHAIHSDLPKHLPYIAVGEHTALLLKNKGFHVVQYGSNGIQNLDLRKYSNILYPCATQPTEIPINATAWPVYETFEAHNIKQISDVNIVSIYSIRGANAIKPYLTKHHTVVCLSEYIAQTFEGTQMQNLVVCDKPDYDRMIKLLCDTADRLNHDTNTI
jgi:uroporphyrinogen-III synthase